MSGSFKKVIGVLAILLALCAGAYFVVLPILESRQKAEFVSALEALPGNFTVEDVKIGLFDKKVIIKGFKGTPDFGPGLKYEVSIGRMELEGVNPEAGYRPGAMPLVDSFKIFDSTARLEFSVALIGETIITSSVRELSGNGLRGDLVSLFSTEPLPALSEEPTLAESQEYLKAYNSLMSALATFHADSIKSSDERMTVSGPLDLTIAIGQSSYSDLNFTKLGPLELRDITGGNLEGELFSIEKLSMRGLEVPDIHSVQFDMEKPEEYSKAMLAAFSKTPLTFKGIVLDKVSVNLQQAEALTIGRAEYDVEFSPEKIVYYEKTKDAVVPLAVYSALSEEFAVFAAVHNKPLLLNSVVDIQVNQNSGKGELLIKEARLEESNIGSVSLSGELPFAGKGEGLEALLAYGPVFFLKSATADIEDKTGMETFLNIQLQQLAKMSPDPLPINAATLRSGIVDAIKAEANQGYSPDMQQILEGFSRLADAPGKLTITASPAEPVQLDSFDAGNAKLDVEINYIPAQ